jgi:hypothetical protein
MASLIIGKLTPPLPNHHIHKYNDHSFVHEVPKYKITGEEHEHWELNRDEGVYENEGAEYKNEEVRYELKELEYKGDGVYKQEELEYEGAEVR